MNLQINTSDYLGIRMSYEAIWNLNKSWKGDEETIHKDDSEACFLCENLRSGSN